MDKLVLTIPEVAAALGYSVGYTYRLAERGRLPVVRLGRRGLRVPREAFQRWLAAETEWPAGADQQNMRQEVQDGQSEIQ